MPEYAAHIDIEAPPRVVFEHLTTVPGLLAWMGDWADISPEPGGVFAVNIQGAPVRGRYLEVEPPHRVVVSWGMAGSADFPAGASRVEFRLEPHGVVEPAAGGAPERRPMRRAGGPLAGGGPAGGPRQGGHRSHLPRRASATLPPSHPAGPPDWRRPPRPVYAVP